ncbi:hypothetical protein LY76DRAFT_194564 [Colletotrichum caudatum]|nr:hypothetical protein LY76DRAFT_194564 [Colletotrichum caudatum]
MRGPSQTSPSPGLFRRGGHTQRSWDRSRIPADRTLRVLAVCQVWILAPSGFEPPTSLASKVMRFKVSADWSSTQVKEKHPKW